MTFSTRDEALDALERARAEYVDHARTIAARICAVGDCITVDDIRALAPPPDGVDPRVMGAVLRAPQWQRVGYVNSRRLVCHKRPVAQFRRVS